MQFRKYPPIPENDFSGFLVMRREQGHGFVRPPTQYGRHDRLMFVGHVPGSKGFLDRQAPISVELVGELSAKRDQ